MKSQIQLEDRKSLYKEFIDNPKKEFEKKIVLSILRREKSYLDIAEASELTFVEVENIFNKWLTAATIKIGKPSSEFELWISTIEKL